MNGKAITWGVVVGVVMTLTLSIPLWAAQSTKQKEIDAEKIEKPDVTEMPTPAATVRFPKPKINEFSCESLTEGYNIRLFGGGRFLSVNCDISAKQGLRSFEILFRGHRVHEEMFSLVGPMVSNRSYRDLRLDLSPHRPGGSGHYTLQARVEDRHGAVATKSIRLRVDMENPRITSLRPPNGSTVYVLSNPASITYEIEASDDFSGVKKVIVEVDMVERYEDSTPPYRITVPNIPVTSRCWWSPDWIRVEDNEGNYYALPYNECELCIEMSTMRFEGPDVGR